MTDIENVLREISVIKEMLKKERNNCKIMKVAATHTWLYVPTWFRSKNRQIHVRFAPINDWVRVLTRPLSRGPIAHYHLKT
jgi:hypothetical protein